ncbi:MAG: hypothetical protein JRH17_06960 [Deltaproteobacteria bacterium]|nr:hypothetical protein [Deltaproteobacteria bacterium]MBW2230108.1 hypothetical protein [Deltaproteobacteria bacterium]MBW2698411.1 hypothetical protein [Deltaproteobacteria bacterium]
MSHGALDEAPEGVALEQRLQCADPEAAHIRGITLAVDVHQQTRELVDGPDRIPEARLDLLIEQHQGVG